MGSRPLSIRIIRVKSGVEQGLCARQEGPVSHHVSGWQLDTTTQTVCLV